MRRKDREVTDGGAIDEIISACECCRLGLNDNGKTYIVPLSFGFENKNGKRIFYFHSAAEGRKIAVLRKDKRVSFELDCAYKVETAPIACGYSAKYSSVMGTGSVDFVVGHEEKSTHCNALWSIIRGKTHGTFRAKAWRKRA